MSLRSHPCTGGAGGGRLAVWNTAGYSLLAVAELQAATLDLAWDPFSANKLATVGAGPHLSLWALLEEPSCRRSRLQVTQMPVPQDLLHTEVRGGGAVEGAEVQPSWSVLQGGKALEFTAEAYGLASKLFVSSSSGMCGRHNCIAWCTGPLDPYSSPRQGVCLEQCKEGLPLPLVCMHMRCCDSPVLGRGVPGDWGSRRGPGLVGSQGCPRVRGGGM